MQESLPGEAFSEDWRFALLVENLSKWQDTFLGHWKLGTGYWTFVFLPSGGASLSRLLLEFLDRHPLGQLALDPFQLGQSNIVIHNRPDEAAAGGGQQVLGP
jgi:hypothetical protein